MKRTRRLGAWLAGWTLIVAGCGGNGDVTETVPDPFAGTRVSVLGGVTGAAAEALQVAMDGFEARTGIAVTYDGSETLPDDLRSRVDGGRPPDIAIVSRPASITEFAAAGHLIELGRFADVDAMRGDFGEYLMGLGAAGADLYGIPVGAGLRGLIWYRPAAFAEAGYEVPQTWTDLIALSDRIVADGRVPWCLGVAAEAAHGWPATDWLEDIVLRAAGPGVYDQWLAHDIPFTAEPIERAATLMGRIFFGSGYVAGDQETIVRTDFRQAILPLFQNPPGCWLHRQATFIADFFPDGAMAGGDVAAFAFPDIEDGITGAVGEAELAILFSADPEVIQFAIELASPEFQCDVASGDVMERVSPHRLVPAECYGNPVARVQAEAIGAAIAAGGFRLDASDLMPAAVGSGTFWTGMVDYVRNGPGNLAEVLAAIEAGWSGG